MSLPSEQKGGMKVSVSNRKVDNGHRRGNVPSISQSTVCGEKQWRSQENRWVYFPHISLLRIVRWTAQHLLHFLSIGRIIEVN